jgi:hypothetical protein
MNAPSQYNAGLADTYLLKSYNNPLLAQSTLADEQKWNDYYIKNDKTPINVVNTEAEQTELAFGGKRARDIENVEVDNPLKTIENASKDIESVQKSKRLRITYAPPSPSPQIPKGPQSQTHEELKQRLDEYAQYVLRLDSTCEDMSPFADQVRRFFKNDETEIIAYITKQLQIRFPYDLYGRYSMSVIIKQCIAAENALKLEQEEDLKRPPPEIQPTFAPDPPPPPTTSQPTAIDGPKQQFIETPLRIAPTPETEGNVLLSVDEKFVTYGGITRIEYTAPLNDSFTQNASNALEASKIQNIPSEVERTPSFAVNTTGGVDVNPARPNNLINEAGEGVATETANDSLKQKKIPSQQRVPRVEESSKVLPITVAVLGASAAVVLYINS